MDDEITQQKLNEDPQHLEVVSAKDANTEGDGYVVAQETV